MTNICATSSDLTACQPPYSPGGISLISSKPNSEPQSPRAQPSRFEEFKEIVSMEEKKKTFLDPIYSSISLPLSRFLLSSLSPLHLQAFEKLHLSFFSSVQFSHSVMSDSLRPHRIQHIRLPCPSPTPGACSNSCPWS